MEINVELQGITPLICNRFFDEAAERATNGSHAIVAAGSKGTPLEQASKKLYLSSATGMPMIPQPNLLRCLVDGGRFFKAGKKQITTKAESLLFSCLDITDAEIPIQHQEPWRVDTRAVRIPATGGRILTHRPMFDDWTLSISLALETSILDEKLLREIIDAAGKRIGLGDFRPATKGPYGKFVVTRWEKQPLMAAY